MNLKFGTSLSDEELEELDRFLISDARSDETMLLDTLDGYLTVIAIGPTSILPSQWLPGIRGPNEKMMCHPCHQAVGNVRCAKKEPNCACQLHA